MTDPRPSENTDTRPEFPMAKSLGLIPPDYLEKRRQAAMRGRFDTDPIDDLIEKAENAHDPAHGAVFAQLATVKAIQAQTEQLRIQNLLALADHSLARFGNYAGEAGGMGTLFSYPTNEVGNVRLSGDVRKALGLS